MLRRIYNRIIRKCFRFFERVFQVHITPLHYYSAIPTTYELKPEVYEKVFDGTGIDWNVDSQLRFLKETAPKYLSEFEPVPNSGLSLVDAFVLYAMIRERKPKKMIEIGSGQSTLVSLKALEANAREGHDFSFQAIEPYPPKFLSEMKDARFALIPKKLQDVPVEVFASVDLLFIDSSHVSKIDSDVNREILEIVPHVKKGALVHWHDIVMPNNYWREWMEDGCMFFNESYMVHAFMLFNSAFRIRWASRFLQLKHGEQLHQRFPYYKDQHHLTSFWIERG